MNIFEPDYLDRFEGDIPSYPLWIDEKVTCPDCDHVWSEDEVKANYCDECGWDKQCGWWCEL